MLAEHYLFIRHLHVASIALSGGVFLLRGLLIQLGWKRFAMASPVRYGSYTVDTVLLVTGGLLIAILPWAAFRNGWLALKLTLVVVYVLLGTLALKRGRSARVRGVCYVAALAVFIFIIGIALAHHPLGWFAGWLA